MIVLGNRPTQDHFSKYQFIIFQVIQNIKKGYVEMIFLCRKGLSTCFTKIKIHSKLLFPL